MVFLVESGFSRTKLVKGFRYIKFIITEPVGEVGYVDGREIVVFQKEKDIAD